MKKIERKDVGNTEVCITGRVYARKDSHSQCGISIVSYTEYGQGWGMDLTNITPNDLRVIADFLESDNGEH